MAHPIYLEDGDTLSVALAPSEALDEIRDYYGTEGYVTLHHLPTATRYTAWVTQLGPEPAPGSPEPDVPLGEAVLTAQRDATTLPLGAYRVEALLTDLAGNRRVVGAVQAQQPGDPVSELAFTLYERRERRWFNVRTADRSTVYASLDRTTVYHAGEGS